MNGHISLDDAINELLDADADDEGTAAYLKQRWLSGAIDSLSVARQRAGLTQADLAARVGTTQSAIARLENDTSGGISLRRYIDVAVACGMAPDPIALVSFAQAVKQARPALSPDGGAKEESDGRV